MSQENEFQLKIKMEIKNAKKKLLQEEINSIVFAIGFALNIACIVIQPLSILTLINCFLVGFFMKLFKPTVKKQFIIAKHINFLKMSMKEKVWSLKN